MHAVNQFVQHYKQIISDYKICLQSLNILKMTYKGQFLPVYSMSVYISLVMLLKKKQYYYLYLLVGVVIIGLIGIQLYWINKTVAVERNAITRNLSNDFEKLASDIEEYSYCYKLYAKTYINEGEGIYLIKQKVDSNGKYVGGDNNGFIDTINLFNFHEQNGDTILENYPSLELTRFAASLDVSFDFSIEGVKDPSQYSFNKLTRENIAQAFDNTLKIDTLLDKQMMDKEIKAILSKNGLDTQYVAGVRKSTSDNYVFITDSAAKLKCYKTLIEVPFFDNHVSSPYLLVIGVPEPFTKIVKSLSVMMLSSAIIVLILVLSFAYFVRTIINERRLSAMKNAFINNITHEFRTPITNINLALENWRETRTNADFYTDIIEEENKHLEKNVDQILQLATLKYNGSTTAHADVNMHDLIQRAIDSFSMQLKNVNGTIELALDADTPLLYACDNEILNMLHNLIDNAIKYSKGEPEIRISTRNVKDWLVTEIEDKGIGMTIETQQHIFEQFYRSNTGDRHDVKGFGLGLSYVKYIVDNHNGRIEVKSKPDKGSSFTIYLPQNRKK